MVKVITDSVSDITPDLAEKWGITVVPLHVHFGTETFDDGVDLKAEEFYHRLERSKSLPTTSTVTSKEMAALFDGLSEDADEILGIYLGTKLSATYEMALKAKEEVKNKSCKIEVIDSRAAIMKQGFLTLEAAKMAKEGKKISEIEPYIRESIPRIHMRGTFDTLEYLRRGGRIGRAQSLIGSILKVNPIVTVEDDGVVGPCGRERNRARAIEYLYNFVLGFKNIKALAVEYGTHRDEAEAFAEKISTVFPREDIILSVTSPVVGTHTGPSIIAVSVWDEPPGMAR
jgi:DegV family protein with EDD domain